MISMLLWLIQPSSLNRCSNAATKSLHTKRVVAPKKPMVFVMFLLRRSPRGVQAGVEKSADQWSALAGPTSRLPDWTEAEFACCHCPRISTPIELQEAQT